MSKKKTVSLPVATTVECVPPLALPTHWVFRDGPLGQEELLQVPEKFLGTSVLQANLNSEGSFLHALTATRVLLWVRDMGGVLDEFSNFCALSCSGLYEMPAVVREALNGKGCPEAQEAAAEVHSRLFHLMAEYDHACREGYHDPELVRRSMAELSASAAMYALGLGRMPASGRARSVSSLTIMALAGVLPASRGMAIATPGGQKAWKRQQLWLEEHVLVAAGYSLEEVNHEQEADEV